MIYDSFSFLIPDRKIRRNGLSVIQEKYLFVSVWNAKIEILIRKQDFRFRTYHITFSCQVDLLFGHVVTLLELLLFPERRKNILRKQDRTH